MQKLQSIGRSTSSLVEGVSDAKAAHKETKEKLKIYAETFEKQHGRKPRKKAEWGEMWGDFERYAALRNKAKEEGGAGDAGGAEPLDSLDAIGAGLKRSNTVPLKQAEANGKARAKSIIFG